jgi:hypothetical protein
VHLAQACYDRSIHLNNENFKSYCNRGYLVRLRCSGCCGGRCRDATVLVVPFTAAQLDRMGQLAKALKDYQTAAALSPQEPSLHFNVGSAMLVRTGVALRTL